MDLVDAAQSQRFLHAPRGVDLLESELGVRMQVAAEGGEFRVVLRDLREGARVRKPRVGGGCEHQCPPAVVTRRRGSTAK